MSYDNENNMRSKDLVLAPNEAVFLQSKTSGIVKSCVGPYMVTISQQESLVVFDNKNKRFIETTNFDKAKQLFTTVPANWYCVLKNPAVNGSHPEAGKSNVAPELDVGKKVNIFGPANFALYPGQMAKVIKGHALRTNQYLLARVYDAERVDDTGKILDTEGNEVKKQTSYVNGQILVIKGTEVSFYMPPTGIEVIPVENNSIKGYVREAVTLERLEYCILKDEDGSKTYKHGPDVVFPKPTETFVTSPKGGYIFRSMELSPISGLYIKVIAEYTEGEGEDAVVHPVGEELFITGKEQNIYYPRPEHTIISYDGKLVHHAIAIPEGEGRYILNRLTGEIKTVKGPSMYLPDPRTEVVVKRKLTPYQCRLWYPGNQEVADYNASLTEKSVERSANKSTTDSITLCCNNVSTSLDSFSYLTASSANDTLAYAESNAKISRGTSYTKPRTITLDNKMDGIVTMEVWNGYAISIMSKNGNRETIVGPAHIMLDYDQVLEPIKLSTGKPKTADKLLETVFLKYLDNKITDIVEVETKDFVKARIRLNYTVDFQKEYMSKWFNIDNYVKLLCDDCRNTLRLVAKNYTIEEFWHNYHTIVRDAIISSDNDEVRMYDINGMAVVDCEVQALQVEQDIEDMLIDNQHNAIRLNLELAEAQKESEIAQARAATEKAEQELRTQKKLNELALLELETNEKMRIQAEQNRKNEAENLAKKQAEADLQVLIDSIAEAQRKRTDAEFAQKLEHSKQEQAQIAAHEAEMATIEEARQKAYAETVAQIMASISSELSQAMIMNGEMSLAASLTENMGAYALSEGTSVVDTAQKLVNGLPFDLRTLLQQANPAQG